MTTGLVRWQDGPRLYVVEASDPKRKGRLQQRRGWLDIGMAESNATLDRAAKHYNRRTGYSVVGMFPHTAPAALKPKGGRR
jgi:hypothetical protein